MISSKAEHGLPHGWCWATVGDTGRYINGFAFKPEHREAAGRPIVRIQNLTDPRKSLNRTSLAVPEEFFVATGEMLLSWSATVDVFIWNREPALVNQHIFRVLPEESLVDKAFLFHWLKVAIDQLLDSEHLHGSTMKHINRGPFMAHRIPLPPLREQQRIAEALEELLSDLDAGVAELKNAQRKLAQYRQSLLKAAVEGALTADWRAARGTPQETGAELLQRILTERRARWEQKQLAKFAEQGKAPPNGWQSDYREPIAAAVHDPHVLPEGWALATGEQLCEFITKGTTPPKSMIGKSDELIPFLRVTNLTDSGELDFSDRAFVFRDIHEGYLSRSVVYPNDVLMNIVGPPLGQVSIVPSDYPQWNINQAIAIFRPVSGVAPTYVSTYLQSRNAQKWLGKRAKTTAGQTNLTLEVCRELPIPLPSLEEQQVMSTRLDAQLESLADQLRAVEHGLRQAVAQRRNILKAAFAGQLVPQDPNDEPASELLARIRAERTARDSSKPAKRGRRARENS